MNITNLLVLSMVKGIGPAFIKRNLTRIMSDNDCLSLISEKKPDQVDYIPQLSAEAETIIADCKSEEIEMISIISSDYPKRLFEISDPPCILYLKGNKALLDKSMAIIGTRRSTAFGNKIAEKLGEYFSKKYAICNGLVEGIDEHSIYVDGTVLSNVVGIISGGLCYKETCSKTHVKVIEDVLSASGLIISEYAPHTKEDQFSGSKASRIQAGLSKGLILVQSSVDGGSKYTIASFAKLGRAMGIVHYPASNEYMSDSFSANRLIVEKKNEGVAEIINLKSTSKLNISSITIIESKNDYAAFSHQMDKTSQALNFGF